eukprot:243924_1
MGGCLTTTDSTTLSENSVQHNDGNDEKQMQSHTTKHSNNHDDENTHKGCATSDMYCTGSDWLKFPICCRYCSNHREPSQQFQLVILGPGYTGKTTLRHHLVQRYGHAFCKADFLMYRDILQHNVLDLFRDLLKKPSLSFKQLKQLIKYIHKHKQSDGYTEYDTDTDGIASPELSPELDLGLHDSSDDDDLQMAYKYMTPKQINSNSSSLRSLELDAEEEDEEKQIDTKTPFSSPMIRCTSNTPSSPINDEFKMMESAHSLCTPCDDDDEYDLDCDKYCVLNQCSPTSTNTTHDPVTFDVLPSPTPVESKNAVKVKHDIQWAISSLLSTLKAGGVEEEEKNAEEEETRCRRRQKEEEEEEIEMLSISQLLDKLSEEQLKYGRDNGRYLILNSDRILSDRFEPRFSDLLQCHVRSTGLMFEPHVICRSLPISGCLREDIVFRVVDVGGHRNERKKWSYVMKQENDVIVFVVSAASFCQVLFEDFKKNAMRESLAVWQDIMSSTAASATQIILVLNKIDLFYERCHLFKQYFNEYSGDMSNKYQILNYIKSLYLDIAKQYAPQHNVHCVVTQLTDTLEIASSDVHQIRHILMKHAHKDIVDTIIDYAIGDVFWSDKWLQPMWQRRNLNKKRRRRTSSLCRTTSFNCDHIKNPHDYHHHKTKKKKKKKRIKMFATMR